jgi:general secretion pathway protein D
MLKRIHQRRGWRLAARVVVVFMALTLAVPAQQIPSAGGGVSRPTRLISLNFRDAPLDQVLNFYAEMTGRSVIKSPGVNATITLRGQTRLTQEEAMQAIESIMAMHNITMIPMGDKFLKVVQINSARQEALPINAALPDEGFAETDHLISQLITLQYLSISEVQPIIQSLLHGYGKIQTLERINSLLVTDTAANLQRILEVLEYVDRPVELKVETRIYELRYAEAGKIASRLNELVQTSQQDQDDKPRAESPQESQVRTPPGVIRARQAQQAAPEPQVSAADLAERGIIQGKVKIVADERTNILIVISEPANFIFFDKIVAVLDRPVEPEIIVRVVALEYADAEEISGILNQFIGAASAEKDVPGAAPEAEEGDMDQRSRALQEFVQRRAQQRTAEAGDEKASIGQLSSSTKILADQRTNSLLLMGRKSDLAALTDIIDQLDVMLAQVVIEAVILEVSLSDSLSYGFDWLQRSMTVYNEQLAGPRGGITIREPVASFGGGWAGNETESFRDASQIGRDNVSLSGGALTYYLTMFDLNIDAVIRMAAASSEARILSTPVVLTTDNTEAKIVAGEERPVVTSTTTSSDTAAQTSQYQYKNIGLELSVTPRINPQGFVVMEITQTADNLLDPVQIDGNEVPVISKREISASIAVENRSTIALGGLVNTRSSKGRSKVPLLGDIPLLGTFFRADNKDSSRSELLVLITPYVLMTPQEARAETIRLHQASASSETKWPAGWSDSELATLSREDIEEMERKEEEMRKQLKEERKAAAEQERLKLRSGLEVEEAEEETIELEEEPQPRVSLREGAVSVRDLPADAGMDGMEPTDEDVQQEEPSPSASALPAADLTETITVSRQEDEADEPVPLSAE